MFLTKNLKFDKVYWLSMWVAEKGSGDNMKTFFWQVYAFLYDIVQFLKPYKYLQKRILEELKLIPHLDILDSGCGTGNSIKEIVSSEKLPYNIKIFGIDISSVMLGKARRKLKKYNGVTFEEKRTEDEAQNERGFDRIISSNSLYTTENPNEVIQNWYNKLEDGGILVLVNPFNPDPQKILVEHLQLIKRERDWKALLFFFLIYPLWFLLMQINKRIAKAAKEGKTVHFIEPGRLEETLKNAGFTILNSEILYGDTCVLFSCQKDTGQKFGRDKEEIIIRRAQTPEEIIGTQKLRYQVYCEEIKSLNPNDYPDEIEIDWFDQYSIHFLAKTRCDIIGCVRLISDTPRGFLLEEEFELSQNLERKRNLIFEFSRIIIILEKRGEKMWDKMLQHAYFWSIKKIKNPILIGVCGKKLWDKMKKQYWDTSIFGNFAKYHNTISAPGVVKPNKKILY